MGTPPLVATGLFGAAITVGAATMFGIVPARMLAADQRGDGEAPLALPIALISAAAGLAAYALALSVLDWRTSAAFGAITACLAAMLVVDLERFLIPDLYPAALLALAIVGPLSQPAIKLIVGAAVGFGLLFAVREVFRRLRGVEAIGFGDLKLLGAIGALTGAEAVLWVITASALIGLGWAAMKGRRSGVPVGFVPFGAASALPAWAALAFGLLTR